ncbi:MAG: hypothetical protein WC114_05975 [Smithellaceae bacterium]
MNPAQMSLFEIPTFNITAEFKSALNDVTKSSKLSREEIIDQMNALAARYGVCLLKGNAKLTMAMFEKWINPLDTSRTMPLKAVPIFCRITQSYEPINAIIRPLGLFVAGEKERRTLKWAELYHAERNARAERKSLESNL